MIYAIGDIHGEIAKLDAMLALLKGHIAPEDTLLFIGDYIDRGPNSPAVLDRVMELKAVRPNTITLRGNHEQMMLDARALYDHSMGARVDPEIGQIWFYNGADNTIAQFGPGGSGRFWERIPQRYWQFVGATEMEFTLGPFRFVHAGVLPRGVFWEEEPLDPRLWIRDPFLISKQDFGKVIVFGHTPLQEPVAMENKIGIDTGAAYGGMLTCAVLDPEARYDPRRVQFIQV